MKLHVPNYLDLGYPSHKQAALDIIRRAANEAEVRIDKPRVSTPLWFMFLLKTKSPVHRWKRFSERSGRTIPGRVCWHGHGAFFREVYSINENVVIETALGRYTSKENFETTFMWTLASGSSRIQPARDSRCVCSDMIAALSPDGLISS